MAFTVMANNNGIVFFSFMCQDVGCSSSSDSEAIEGAVAAERSEDMEEERNSQRPDERRETSVGQGRGGRRGSGRGRMRGRGRGQGRSLAQQRANESFPWVRDAFDPTLQPYSSESGPQTTFTGVLEIFMQMVGLVFFSNLVENTNLYGSSSASWCDTFVEEMKVFVGINILMGIHRLPSYVDYWSSDPALRVSYVADTMPRKRYEELCRYLHCSNPGMTDSGDKLHKVRPFMCVLQETFPKLLRPWKNLSVDEAMIKFDGRLLWKQYLPKKPVRWGIKIWCLCDSLTGYCLAFNVYTGREGDVVADDLGLGYRVVMGLMSDYLYKTYMRIFFFL